MSIPEATGSADELARCEALVAALPEELAGLSRRTVTPAAALGAAWGDPPVVLSCGVPQDTIPPTAPCQVADGVGWYIPEEAYDDQAADVALTTLDVRPVVHVQVPGRYRPPPAIMVALAPLLKEHLAPVADPVC